MISLLHPSRGRPEQAKATFDYWMKNASGQVEIEHILSLDYDDPQRTEYEYFGPNSRATVDHNSCVVEATNQAAQCAKGDILIYLSDDFKCPENWDLLILQEFGDDAPQLLKVDDCLQPFEKDVLTIPIMNKELYRRLGYFWNPIYKSMFVDQDLYWVCANSNWIAFAKHLKFPHEHYSVGKATRDATYMRSDLNWNQGKEIYRQRKMEGFRL